MKWRRRIDYHGFRSYGETEDRALRLDLAVMAGWAKRQIERLMRTGAPRTDVFRTLLNARERNFSVLGAANENQREEANSLWPTVAELTGGLRGVGGDRRKPVEVGEQPRA